MSYFNSTRKEFLSNYCSTLKFLFSEDLAKSKLLVLFFSVYFTLNSSFSLFNFPYNCIFAAIPKVVPHTPHYFFWVLLPVHEIQLVQESSLKHRSQLVTFGQSFSLSPKCVVDRNIGAGNISYAILSCTI